MAPNVSSWLCLISIWSLYTIATIVAFVAIAEKKETSDRSKNQNSAIDIIPGFHISDRCDGRKIAAIVAIIGGSSYGNQALHVLKILHRLCNPRFIDYQNYDASKSLHVRTCGHAIEQAAFISYLLRWQLSIMLGFKLVNWRLTMYFSTWQEIQHQKSKFSVVRISWRIRSNIHELSSKFW